MKKLTKIKRSDMILGENCFQSFDTRKTHLNNNIVVVGSTGSGKTRYFIKPNLMQMNSNYVITDPKGTIVNELGDMFIKHGYKLKILNLCNMANSMHYNPFAYIQTENDILKFVDIFMQSSKQGRVSNDPFWDQAERLLFSAIIAMGVFYFTPEERNLNTVATMIRKMEVREEDETFKNAVDLMFDDLEKEEPDCFAVKQYKSFKLAAGKTAKSILISTIADLCKITTPAVSKLIEKDEMDLLSISKEKTAMFIIISDTDKTFNFLVNVLYTQLFNLLCTTADEDYGGPLPIHVRFMLDEFANIGLIPEFQMKIATIRSRNISVAIMLQAEEQLYSLYGISDGEIIIQNCSNYIIMGTNSFEYEQKKSEQLGIKPQELHCKKYDECFLIQEHQIPIKLKMYDITQHPMYKYHADGPNDYRWFDVEKFIKEKHRKSVITQEEMRRRIENRRKEKRMLKANQQFALNNTHSKERCFKHYIEEARTTQELYKYSNTLGLTFENDIAELYRWLGFSIKMTPASHDFGVDIIAKNSEETIAIQCKWSGKDIEQSADAIKEVFAGKEHYNDITRCQAITNTKFTQSAVQLAKDTNVELIDKYALALLKIRSETQKTNLINELKENISILLNSPGLKGEINAQSNEEILEKCLKDLNMSILHDNYDNIKSIYLLAKKESDDKVNLTAEEN